ncbi:MAG: hypothetical protein JNL98_08160 [Bryobacterales bacterium]|nr:hypothetical protein [Bryobacterales bacterium]
MLEASIHDASRTVTTTYYPSPSPGMVFRKKDNPENGCALQRTQFVDSSEIFGVTCQRYRRTWQEPDGQSATEDIWMAPAIGCEIVQSKCEWSRGGTLTNTFERIPKEISIGPPDDVFFVVPADYEEVPPSRQMESLGGAPRGRSPHEGERIKSWDLKYYESQKYKPPQP